MRLLTAVSTVRVCQGQPNKRKHSSNDGCFSFAVGHPTVRTERVIFALQKHVVDARPLSLPSAKSVKVVGQRRTSLSGAAKRKASILMGVFLFAFGKAPDKLE